MANATTQQPTTEDKAREKMAKWIDPNVITDIIFDSLDEFDIKPTFENAKKLWLAVLNNLFDTTDQIAHNFDDYTEEFNPEFENFTEELN